MEAYSSVTVVKLDTDRAGHADQTVADALENLPGIQIVRHSSAGQQESVTIRGSSSSQVRVFVEGFDAADPGVGAADLSSIPLDAVEAIEVYRGPRGAAAGSGAVGGAVVIRLRKGGKPVLSQTLGLSGFGPAGPDGGSGGITARGKNVFFSYTHGQAEGKFDYVDTNGHARARENNDSVSDKLTMAWTPALGERTKLDMLASAALTERGSAGLEQFPSPDARERGQSFLAGGKVTAGAFPSNSFTSTASASWGLWNWRFSDPESLLGYPIDNESHNHRLQGAADTAFRKHGVRLTGGAAAAAELVDVNRNIAAPVGNDRFVGDLVAGAGWGSGSDPAEVSARVRLAVSDKHGAIPVPGIDGIWRFSQALALTGSLARSYRLPSLDELYFEARGVRGNPDLQPEDSLGGDFGIRLDLPDFEAEASVFLQSISDTILFIEKTANLVEAQNTGAVISRGAEIGAAATLRPFMLCGSLAFLDAFFEESGNALPLRSRWTGSLEGRLNLGRFSGWVTGSWRSMFFLDRFESRSEEGRFLLDAGLSVNLGAGFRVLAQAHNLTDKRDAIDSFQYPLPGLSWHGLVEKQWTQE